MRLEGKTICVTGTAGFLGVHLCRRLMELGSQVIALDNFAIGSRNGLPEGDAGLTVYQADIRDVESLREPMAKADLVYHLAAIANPRTCQQDFTLAFDVNVRGTAHVLEACRESNIPIFDHGLR